MIQTQTNAKIDALLREKARKSLYSFMRYHVHNFQHNWHFLTMSSILNKVERGEIKKVIISMPPRHGKSETVSVNFPAYVLGRNPNKKIISASYSSTLAAKMSRGVQRVMDSDRYRATFNTKLPRSVEGILDPSKKRTNLEFDVVGGFGGYRAVGVGGGLTGFGADLLIIDDPIKNKEEAMSEIYRERIWDWYTSTASTRLEKGGATVVVMTRWHDDDLIGRLLASQNDWFEIKLEAICERKFDFDQRQEGEALWPDKYDLQRLMEIKAQSTSDWSSLYQQNPVPQGGGLFKTEWWKHYNALPNKFDTIVQFWDCAQKVGLSNDYSVCATWGKNESGFYILDVWRKKVEAPQLQIMAKAMYEKYRPNAVVIEDKSSGSSLIQYLRQGTTIPVLAYDPKQRDKQIRASVATPQVEAGNVYLPETAPWLADFLLEHELFPFAAHDDMVDTTSMAIEYFQNQSTVGPRVRRL